MLSAFAGRPYLSRELPTRSCVRQALPFLSDPWVRFLHSSIIEHLHINYQAKVRAAACFVVGHSLHSLKEYLVPTLHKLLRLVITDPKPSIVRPVAVKAITRLLRSGLLLISPSTEKKIVECLDSAFDTAVSLDQTEGIPC